MDDVLRNALTPQWQEEMTPPVREMMIAADVHAMAGFTGVLLSLMDYCRQHMPQDDWQYVLRQMKDRLAEYGYKAV